MYFNIEIEAISSVHTENAELDTFLSKTAGLWLGQKPARVTDKDMERDLVKLIFILFYPFLHKAKLRKSWCDTTPGNLILRN
jgi:hypothetical protein